MEGTLVKALAELVATKQKQEDGCLVVEIWELNLILIMEQSAATSMGYMLFERLSWSWSRVDRICRDTCPSMILTLVSSPTGTLADTTTPLVKLHIGRHGRLQPSPTFDLAQTSCLAIGVQTRQS